MLVAARAIMGAIELRARVVLMPMRQHAVRSTVAALSAAAGVCATALALGLSGGAERELAGLAARSGADILMIRPVLSHPRQGFGVAAGWYPAVTLRENDVQTLSAGVPGVRVIAPITEAAVTAVVDGERAVTTLRGGSAAFLQARGLAVEYGRGFAADDATTRARVAILGRFTADRLGGAQNLVGRQFDISRVPFTVIGVLREKGAAADGSNEDDQVVVPLETAMLRFERKDYFNGILVEVGDLSRLSGVESEVREALRKAHGLKADARDDFDILLPARENEMKRMRRQMLVTLSALFAAITGGIGAIGIFTVTHLNVSSRTAEIGLRRAIGATNGDVALLFLAEAATLGAAGGVVGVASAVLVTRALERLTDWSLSLGFGALLASFLGSCAVGVLAGMLPAWKALRLIPAVALRT